MDWTTFLFKENLNHSFTCSEQLTSFLPTERRWCWVVPISNPLSLKQESVLKIFYIMKLDIGSLLSLDTILLIYIFWGLTACEPVPSLGWIINIFYFLHKAQKATKCPTQEDFTDQTDYIAPLIYCNHNQSHSSNMYGTIKSVV